MKELPWGGSSAVIADAAPHTIPLLRSRCAAPHNSMLLA